jgi:hypothetical protein
MDLYENEKYITNIENLKNTLDRFGVAVIPELLNDKQCENGKDGMWDFLEHISHKWKTPMMRQDKSSYKEFWKLFPMHSMLLQHWKIGHSQFIWDIRQNEKVVNVFSQGLWNCQNEELLVSFDGASFHIPPEYTQRGWFRNNLWIHTDQSFTRPEFECVQAFVTLEDINVGDATLCILEGSHKYHKDFQEQFNITDKKDWYKLKQEEIEFYTRKCHCDIKRISCPKGSMILWDSRTLHCGVEPLRTRPHPNFRSIVYVCYMPRILATKASILKKKKAFQEMRMTSHWPCRPKLFPKLPQTYGAPLPKIESIGTPELSELGMKLAGY